MPNQKAYVFTINNYTENDISKFNGELVDESNLSYIICGRELGENNGTPHLQGYFRTIDRTSIRKAKEILSKFFEHTRFHMEPARGNQESNIRYCSKQCTDEKPLLQLGQPSNQTEGANTRNKTDYKAVLELAKRGDLKIMEESYESILVRHWKTIHSIRSWALNVTPDHNRLAMDNFYLWGKPGTGKTTWAKREYPNIYIKDDNKSWWDGYNGEKAVLFDDVEEEWMKTNYRSLLKIADWGPFRAEIKGGYMLIRPEVVILTSNRSWHEILRNVPDCLKEALERRFKDGIKNFNEIENQN